MTTLKTERSANVSATRLDATLASRFASSTFAHLTREWPYAAGHVQMASGDIADPQVMHPMFYGSFDWHSCVHGWWQVLRLTRLFPEIPETGRILELAATTFVPDLVAREAAYFGRPASAGFERPYGWAWLLSLHAELVRRPELPWARALEPLARAIADRFARYLPKLTYPIRSGKHDCTAFASMHALAWARTFDATLARAIEERAIAWFGSDRDCRPWEPGGEDFLSAALCEAALMRDVLAAECTGWLHDFFPDVFGDAIACLRAPVVVSDRGDGRLAHLDGLNLSRAWCWRSLADASPDPARCYAIAEAHLAASLPHLADDYMGEHWLATFALLALDAPFGGVGGAAP